MSHRAASVTVIAYINEGEGVGSVAADIGAFQGGLVYRFAPGEIRL